MNLLAHLMICLRFFSRLPVAETARERALGAGGLAAAAAMAPLAGVVLALIPAAVLVAAKVLGLPPDVAAPLAIAGLAAVTGALHEDALADCADGFGGGRTRARKLEIMRDSRIGAFGAVAIVLSLYIRVVALAAILGGAGPGAAIASLIAAAALSRAGCLVPLALLPPARSDGAGAAAADPGGPSVAIACGLASVLAMVAGFAVGSLPRGLLAAVAAGGAALAMSALARRQIGGQTGDVAGATQQVAEIAVLLVFCAA